MTPVSGITVAGKAPPDSEELRLVKSHGFDEVELYLEPHHLSDLNSTIEIVENAPLDVVSVHTPHVSVDESAVLRRSDRLASVLGAYLVVHSNRIAHTFVPELEELQFQSAYGYESNPGVSVHHIENTILKRGLGFVLDTAHIYMAETDYLAAIDQLLREWGDGIEIVHLCDSSSTVDGLGLGRGEMDIERVVGLLWDRFDGTVVLEVMPEEQGQSLGRLNTYLTG